MYRTHHCGALRIEDLKQSVTLSGWVQKSRNKGFIVWLDLRDRFGITQLVFDEERTPKAVFEKAQNLGREFVIQIRGSVIERESKNPSIHIGVFGFPFDGRSQLFDRCWLYRCGNSLFNQIHA